MQERQKTCEDWIFWWIFTEKLYHCTNHIVFPQFSSSLSSLELRQSKTMNPNSNPNKFDQFQFDSNEVHQKRLKQQWCVWNWVRVVLNFAILLWVGKKPIKRCKLKLFLSIWLRFESRFSGLNSILFNWVWFDWKRH